MQPPQIRTAANTPAPSISDSYPSPPKSSHFSPEDTCSRPLHQSEACALLPFPAHLDTAHLHGADMPPRPDEERQKAASAWQAAKGDTAKAKEIFKELAPDAAPVAKPKRFFQHALAWASRKLDKAARCVAELGRPKILTDAMVLALAAGPLQGHYYSHGTARWPSSMEEVSPGCALKLWHADMWPHRHVHCVCPAHPGCGFPSFCLHAGL